MADDKQTIFHKLNREAGKIAWRELQPFFAAGQAVFVDTSLDLIDIASEMALDNKALLEPLVQAGQVAVVSDEQAGQWLAQDTLVWAVVLAPLVLVQAVQQ